MNRYRVLLPLTVHTEEGAYTQGEEFEKEFSAEDEWENLQSGLLEIVPREYRVISDSHVYETAPGETFTAAIPKGQEEVLLGVHLERVEAELAKPKRSRKPSSDKG